jgi:transposase
MANQRINIVKIKEIFRLFFECNLSKNKISRALKISRPVVIQYIIDFKATGLTYDEIKKMPDDKVNELFNKKKNKKVSEKYEQLRSKFEYFSKELKRKGVTLFLLWEEHNKDYPHSYSYSQFCYHFQVWRETSEVSMHIDHKAGDKAFADFTGHKFPIIDRKTGKEKRVEMFVSILGGSQLTYAEAVKNQKKENWIQVNINSLEYFGGVPQAIMPDNLKSAVTKADKYDPDINPEYNDFAAYYNTVIFPARPRRPKDKALVENAVKLIYQRVFAPLRNHMFYSIEELNTAVREKLEEHNNKPLTKLKISRRELFNQTEKHCLKPLPAVPYAPKNIIFPTIQINYHVYLPEDKHYYSVPYYLRRKNKKAKILYSSRNVEIFHNGIRVASYKRDKSPNGYTTRKEHMPPHHRYVAEWNPERISKWASEVGENTALVAKHILNTPAYPEQAYRTCVGIISLSKKYGSDRLNNACRRAINFNCYTLKSIKNILANGLDRSEEEQLTFDILPTHENIRGSEYYSQMQKISENQENSTHIEAVCGTYLT